MVERMILDGKPITDVTWDAATEMMRQPEVPFDQKISLFRLMTGPLPPRRRWTKRRIIMCEKCGTVVLRKGAQARFCEGCARVREHQARTEFYRKHGR